MSKTTIALEAAVRIVIDNTPAADTPATNRQRAAADRAFAGILTLIAPRIRHFIRQYGLVAHWDDAEQCCAIGVHRAIQAYDPSKAQFTTFVNWQLRGELQALRFRLMTDQRSSAKKVSAATVSLHAPVGGGDGEETSLEALIVDEESLDRTEAAAADHMAALTRKRLIDQYLEHLRTVGMDQLRRRARKAAPSRTNPAAPRLRAEMYPVDPAELAALEAKIADHREAVERRLGLDVAIDDAAGNEAERERKRQIAKRAAAALTDIVDADPAFASMLRARPLPRRPRTAA